MTQVGRFYADLIRANLLNLRHLWSISLERQNVKFRKFNGLDFSTSEVGLGCWQLGGSDWGDVSDAQAHEILAVAVASGVG